MKKQDSRKRTVTTAKRHSTPIPKVRKPNSNNATTGIAPNSNNATTTAPNSNNATTGIAPNSNNATTTAPNSNNATTGTATSVGYVAIENKIAEENNRTQHNKRIHQRIQEPITTEEPPTMADAITAIYTDIKKVNADANNAKTKIPTVTTTTTTQQQQ